MAYLASQDLLDAFRCGLATTATRLGGQQPPSLAPKMRFDCFAGQIGHTRPASRRLVA